MEKCHRGSLCYCKPSFNAAPPQSLAVCLMCNTYHTHSTTRLSYYRMTDDSTSDSDSEDEIFINSNNQQTLDISTELIRKEIKPTSDLANETVDEETISTDDDAKFEFDQWNNSVLFSCLR